MVEERHYPTPAPAPELSDLDKELEEQKKDMEKAVEEEKQAEAKMADLPPPFTTVKIHTGIGPIYFETIRGLVRVNNGDVMCKFEYEDPLVPGVTLTEVVVLNLVALEALQAANIQEPDIPIGLEARAARITAKRHKDALPKVEEKPKVTNPIVKPPVATTKPTQLPAR